MKKKQRLTIGCRARILTIKEKPKQTGPRFFANESSWRESFGGREVLLVERSQSDFSVMLLGKGVKDFKRKDPNTADGGMAWVPESDMVLINKDFDTNLDFIDWYQEHEDEFCPDCGAWFPENDGMDTVCPNQKCPGENY
ncbi:hypothetical protein LCGC14_0805820 [marine sediment metagenome]|uniref:Uncharacterized protein n=1 Tax=marine sediment metagenome TaxID=412755 RepID=A0A0F9SVI9_9ZZZZ